MIKVTTAKEDVKSQEVQQAEKRVAKDILTAWYDTFGYVDDYKVFKQKATQYGLYEEITRR